MKLKAITFILLSVMLFPFSAWADLSKTEVSQLYVSIFGRASEGGGNAYWQAQSDMTTAANTMLDTQAAKDYFGANLNTNQAFIEHIYLNTLNKTIADDFGGISYWVNLLDTGTTRGEAVASLVGAINDYAPDGRYYNPDDIATVAAYNQFMNRVEVSDYMADNVHDSPEDWQTSTSFSHGIVVTADPASVDTAKAAVNGLADDPVISEGYNPSLELVVDDTVIDFGRLDSKRRNLGASTALGTIPVYPWPIPPYEAVYTVYYQDESDPDLIYPSDVPVRNLCTYLDGTTYFKTLPNLPPDPDHINPDQYSDGMTCVFAVMVAPDSHPYLIQHGSSEPMFGNGNIYTAIPVPGGVAAGTLIDNYETLDEYNSMISTYADSGYLSVQPHIRSAGSPSELARLTAPQGVLYVIAFSDGRVPVTSGQTVTESPNPLDPLAIEPSGVVVDLTVEQGAWNQGNASGYIWMSPVTDDFWDLRHSEGTGDAGLWVNGRRVATLSYVGQALPLLWEAPDNPDVPQTTHDRRHLFPDAVPAGGMVQLEATVLDEVNPDVILDTVFAAVAYPVPLPEPEEPDDPPSGNCGAYVAPGVWKEFDCYNLAAIGKTTNDDPFTPSWRLIGGYWQWGRKGPSPSDWYDTNTEHFAHGPTGPGSSEANDDFIYNWDSDYAPDGAWSGSYKTSNDPCSAGYRVPTISQWEGVIDNNTQSTVGTWDYDDTNYSSARFFGSDLMLPAAGSRNNYSGNIFSGALSDRGGVGYYWSSSKFSSYHARSLLFGSGSADKYGASAQSGFSVRCVAE